MAAKGIIRSIQRCEAKEISLANKICKAIPSSPGITLAGALKESPELKELYDNDNEVKGMVDEAMKLEGLAKTVGQHACGILVAPDSVSKFIPQQLLKNKNTGKLEPTTQFTGGECENAGLLKMDFLGLRTLGVLKEAVADVNKVNPNANLTLDSIDIYDKQVYKFLAQGNTDAV